MVAWMLLSLTALPAPAAAPPPLMIQFQPPAVGMVQVLRYREESTHGACAPVPALGRPSGAPIRCVRHRMTLERTRRYLRARPGQVTYEVSYSAGVRARIQPGASLVQWPSHLVGQGYRVATTPARPTLTDLHGAPLARAPEEALLREHLAYSGFDDLALARTHLTVLPGAIVPSLAKAVLPVLRHSGLTANVNPSTLKIQFSGTERRAGRTLARFTMRVRTAATAAPSNQAIFDGGLLLEVSTGRLVALELRIVVALIQTGTLQLEADYP